MEGFGSIRRRRFAFFNNVERRAHRIWGKRTNISTQRLFRRIIFLSLVLLFLFVVFVLHPALSYNQHLDTAYKEDSLDYAENVAVKLEDPNLAAKRYSTEALKSKPKARFKVTEQHKRILARFQRHVGSDDWTSERNYFDRQAAVGMSNMTTNMPNTTMDMSNTTMDMTTENVTETTTESPTTPVISTSSGPDVVIVTVTVTNPLEVRLLGALGGIAGLIFFGFLIGILIFCCCPCQCCFLCLCCRRKRRDQDIEMVDAATLTLVMEEDDTGSWLAKEEMLKDAIEVGKVSVLEFALKEARYFGDKIDDRLIHKAEISLNKWKRTLNLLDEAYKNKDISAVLDYQKRFEDLDIQDDSGIYERSLDLLNLIQDGVAKVDKAATDESEEEILAALANLENIGLPLSYIDQLDEVKHAKEILDAIKHDKYLKGKTAAEMESALKHAIEHRNGKAISLTLSQIESAGLTGFGEMIEEGHKLLKELEDEHEKLRDEAWTQLQDASQQRNAAGLRDSLRQCTQYGVEEEQIKAGEKLLKIVEREDQLLEEMRELIDKKDSSKLLEAIAVFRTPGLMMVDKSGVVERADQLLLEIRDKERLQRAKGDVIFRLQRAIETGQVDMLEHMIKALENIASMGEDIDEAVLSRAKTRLETFKGRLDYRVRMERIKTAIERMGAAEKLAQLADLIEQMVELSGDEQYTMTTDDLRVLDESRVLLHDLRRKHAIRDEIDSTRPLLSLPQVPDSLEKLTLGVQTMTRLKESAAEFKGVFSLEDDTLLDTATLSASELQQKVEERDKIQEKLSDLMESCDHEALVQAIAEAQEAEFVDEDKVQKAQELCEFINPIKRAADLKQAIRARDIAILTQSIADFKEAKVPEQAILLETAERRLKKLKKLEKKKKKADKKRRKEEKRRQAEINELNLGLKIAMEAQDTDLLQDALEKCENSGYDHNEIPLYTTAEEFLDKLTIERLRASLSDAIERRDISAMEKSIDEAEYGGYINELGDEYRKAKDLLFHLQELHRLRKSIAGMNRSLISELCRYPAPPRPVHVVMTAALVMLGEKKKNVTNWNNVQAQFGKLGEKAITRRVKRCAPGDITPELRNEVQHLLQELDVDKMREISQGAATFFDWMHCMMKESYYASNPSGGHHEPPSTSSAANVNF